MNCVDLSVIKNSRDGTAYVTKSFQSQGRLLLFEFEITKWACHKITQFHHSNKLKREKWISKLLF